jgi:uncharacterized protein (TIGR03083 family)
MTEAATHAIRALRRYHYETAPLVSGLNETQLAAPSGSSEWTIAQVLSHLGSAAENALRELTEGRNDPDANRQVWDRWDAMSPAQHATECVAAQRRLVEALEALTDDELRTRRIAYTFMPEPVDIEFFVRMRINEAALHRWDIDVAFQPNPVLLNYLVPFALDQIPIFGGYMAKPMGVVGTVRFDTTDPTRRYLYTLRGDSASVTADDGANPHPDTTLRLPAEAFVRLVSGRLSPTHTPEGVSVEGALTLDDVRRIFPGI